MALTITTQPTALQTGFNPVVYAFSGTNNTHQGYRYLVDVYSGNTTDSIIARLKVTPTQYGDGYADVSRILNNFLSVDFDSTSQSDPNASNSYLKYSARIGEEYLYEWPYQQVTSASTAPYARFVVLSATTGSLAPIYTAGDQIEVITTSTGPTAVVNGLHTVVTATSNTITLDIIYPASQTGGLNILAITGNTTFADRRNQQYTGLTASTGTTVVNGALDWPDWKAWVATDYMITNAVGSTTKKLLTSLNRIVDSTSIDDRFYMTPTQSVWINFQTDAPASFVNVVWELRNQTGTLQTSGTYPITATFSGDVKQFRIGFTALSLNPTKGQYIQFWLRQNSGINAILSKTYKIYADVRCARETLEIYYKDRYGGILSQSFQLISTESISSARNTIKTAIQYGANSALDLSTPSTISTNVDVDRNYLLNTDWLSDGNIKLMEELISSRNTWLKIDGNYLPVIVQDNGYEVTKQRNKRLQRKTVNVQIANQRPIN